MLVIGATVVAMRRGRPVTGVPAVQPATAWACVTPPAWDEEVPDEAQPAVRAMTAMVIANFILNETSEVGGGCRAVPQFSEELRHDHRRPSYGGTVIRRLVILATSAVLLAGVVVVGPLGRLGSVSAAGTRVEALLLGDSVMNGMAQGYSKAARALLAKKHSYILDSAGCRRLIGYSCHIGTHPAPTTALHELNAHAGDFEKVIVVAAGYNDPTSGSEGIGTAVDTFMRIAKAQNVRWVIWLTYREAGGPGNIRRLHNHNLVLAAKRAQYKNLRLADWAHVSRSLPSSWFSGDGIHLGGSAASAMATLISNSIDALPVMDRCDAVFLTGRNVPAPVALGASTGNSLHLLDRPVRVADSRRLWGAVGGGRELVVPVTGISGVPVTASGVTAHVSVDQPCGPTDVKVHACGTALPVETLISTSVAATISTTVRLRNGALCVWTSAPADLQVDLTGYTLPGAGGHVTSTALVLFDSVTGHAQALTAAQHRLTAGERLTVDLVHDSVPDIGGGVGVEGVQLRIDTVAPTANGRMFVLPGACTSAPSPIVSGRAVAASDTSFSAWVRLVTGKVCIITETATDLVVHLQAVDGVAGDPIELSAAIAAHGATGAVR